MISFMHVIISAVPVGIALAHSEKGSTSFGKEQGVKT